MMNLQISLETEEAALIDLCRKDIRHFEPLYIHYYKPIYRFVANRVASMDDVSDITSQTFVKAMSNIGKYKAKGYAFSAWLYRIASNEVTDYYRRNSRRYFVNIEDSGIEKLKEEGISEIDTAEGRALLTNALNRLVADEIQLIQLRYFDDLSYAEIAAVLNMTENNARVKIFRTIKRLQTIYNNEIQ